MKRDRIAACYDEAAVLALETGRRMAERLDLVRISPARIVDIGCGTGVGIRELRRRYPAALLLAADMSLPMLQAVHARSSWIERIRGRSPRCLAADGRVLPLADGSVGLAWSNLALQRFDDLRPAFAEAHRVLEVGGLLTFSTLGPDTLKELRVACAKVGAGDTVRRFPDMHDIGDMLVAAGFADPVMDMEMITLTYATPRGFLRDQRYLGERNAMLGMQPWRAWRLAMAAWQRVDGRLPASFEIVYGHAWRAAERERDARPAIVRFSGR